MLIFLLCFSFSFCAVGGSTSVIRIMIVGLKQYYGAVLWGAVRALLLGSHILPGSNIIFL